VKLKALKIIGETKVFSIISTEKKEILIDIQTGKQIEKNHL